MLQRSITPAFSKNTMSLVFQIFEIKSTMNLIIETHRQWQITRKDIAEFLETWTKYHLWYNSVIYFHLCLEVWQKNGVEIPPNNKIRVAETLDPLTKMSTKKWRSDKTCFLPRFQAFDYDHFCITLMPNIPRYAICLFLIKDLTFKGDI